MHNLDRPSDLATAPSRYLVTGCAGFIGSHLAEVLLEGGHEVVGVDAFTDYYPMERKLRNLAALKESARFMLIEIDLATATLEPLLEGIAGVFHLAARPGVRSSFGALFARYVHDNILGSQRLFEAAAEAGVRVVFASSSSVYGDALAYPTHEDTPPHPVSPYGVTKVCCEQLAGAYASACGLDHVALRYFTVYGPRQRPDMAFARIVAALTGGPRFELSGTGEQSRDFTFVGDAVAAMLASMNSAPAGACYNVGGGSEVTMLEAIEMFERIAGRPVNLVRRRQAVGDVTRTAADTSRIRTELGWEPRIALEQGLALQLENAGGSIPRTGDLMRFARML